MPLDKSVNWAHNSFRRDIGLVAPKSFPALKNVLMEQSYIAFIGGPAERTSLLQVQSLYTNSAAKMFI